MYCLKSCCITQQAQHETVTALVKSEAERKCCSQQESRECLCSLIMQCMLPGCNAWHTYAGVKFTSHQNVQNNINQYFLLNILML